MIIGPSVDAIARKILAFPLFVSFTNLWFVILFIFASTSLSKSVSMLPFATSLITSFVLFEGSLNLNIILSFLKIHI